MHINIHDKEDEYGDYEEEEDLQSKCSNQDCRPLLIITSASAPPSPISLRSEIDAPTINNGQVACEIKYSYVCLLLHAHKHSATY